MVGDKERNEVLRPYLHLQTGHAPRIFSASPRHRRARAWQRQRRETAEGVAPPYPFSDSGSSISSGEEETGAAGLHGTEPPVLDDDDDAEEDECGEGGEGDHSDDSVGSSDRRWELQRQQQHPNSDGPPSDHDALIGPLPADSVGNTAESRQTSSRDASMMTEGPTEAGPAPKGSGPTAAGRSQHQNPPSSSPGAVPSTAAEGQSQRQKPPLSDSYGAGLRMLRTNARRLLVDASAHFVDGIRLESLSDNQVGEVGWGTHCSVSGGAKHINPGRLAPSGGGGRER